MCYINLSLIKLITIYCPCLTNKALQLNYQTEISSSNLDQAFQRLNLLEEILLDFINLLLIVHVILI